MLREFQQTVGEGLLQPFKAAAPAGVVAGDAARAAARFMIHRGNVVESLASALALTYPAVKTVCGEENFRVLAAAFVRRHPPARPELLSYGDGFAAFTAGQAAAVSDFPYLPDLARLEWALNVSYYAAEAPVLEPSDLAAIPPENLGAMRLALHPAARLVESVFAVHAIWAAVSAGNAAPDPLPERGETVLVFRNSDSVDAVALGRGEAVFLGTVAAGASLEKALTEAELAEPGFDASAALAAALTRGALGAEVSFNP
jgi:hypothetical protein